MSINAVEIEEQVSALAELSFDPDEFLFAFLEAFGNKSTAIKRLCAGTSNKSTNQLLQFRESLINGLGCADIAA